jgi:hypothetical protein
MGNINKTVFEFLFRITSSVITFLSFTSHALAEINEVINCNNQNADLNEVVVWVENRPLLLKHNAYITTKNKGKIPCKISWYATYGDEWDIECDNGAIIYSVLAEGIYVIDKNGSQYKMENPYYHITATCNPNTVVYKQHVIADQKAFQFEIFIETTYQRKLTPAPVGF